VTTHKQSASEAEESSPSTIQLGARINTTLKKEVEQFCKDHGYRMNALLERWIRDGLSRDRDRRGSTERGTGDR
jgi:hypothetical protein